MAEVVESGLSGEVFVVPLHQAVFRFAREYWDAQGTAPSAKVLGTEYPGLDVEAPKGEDGALGWVIWKLFKRRQTNRLQDMLRSAAETMHSDPLDAAKTLQLAAGQMLEQTGRSSGEGIYADVGAMLDNRLPESPKPEVLARSDGSAVTD
jgi:hypothetical protein